MKEQFTKEEAQSMKKQMLNGVWGLHCEENRIHTAGNIPGSVYSILLENHMMEDPYYRMNEVAALSYMDYDYQLQELITCFAGGNTMSQIF